MLRNLGIRSKLLALVALPTALLIAVSLVLALSYSKNATAAGGPWALLVLAAALIGVAGVLVAVLALSRRLVEPLHRLTEAASEVTERLPMLVARLQNGERATAGQPEAGDEPELEPVPVESADEIGLLAQAFNTVNETTIRIAGEQAALRASIAETFVNVARRNQVLLGRQLALIDGLEQHEEDPDQLDNLFKLDHLATRMRRNAESLLVLAGVESTRRLRRPLALSDVVRTAASEIEQYDRVDLAVAIDPAVDGRFALSAAHLLAELLENATHFSDPGTRVAVVATMGGAGVLLTVTDAGLGMTDDELARANDVITSRPDVGAATSSRLGFLVVGRLAARLGATVTVRRGLSAGTMAEVVLPVALFADLRSNEITPSTAPLVPVPVVPVTASANAGANVRPAQPQAEPAAARPLVFAPAIDILPGNSGGRRRDGHRFGRRGDGGQPPLTPPDGAPAGLQPTAAGTAGVAGTAGAAGKAGVAGTAGAAGKAGSPSVSGMARRGSVHPPVVPAQAQAPAGRSGAATGPGASTGPGAATGPGASTGRGTASGPASRPSAGPDAPALGSASVAAEFAALAARHETPATPRETRSPAASPGGSGLRGRPGRASAMRVTPGGAVGSGGLPARERPRLSGADGSPLDQDSSVERSLDPEEIAQGAHLASAALAELSRLSSGYEPAFSAAAPATDTGGLTRRQPKPEAPTPATQSPAAARRERDAAQVRSRLAGFRAGVERGRASDQLGFFAPSTPQQNAEDTQS